MILPGLIDVHVHLREPGAVHKEDWGSGTSAALAGGITCVLAMPNTDPPVTNDLNLSHALAAARQKARCDYAHYLGAGPDNIETLPGLSDQAIGLKMYLDQTYGPLRLEDMALWMEHFVRWPHDQPIAVHAEGRSMAAAILIATFYERSLHICHVSRREEIVLIRAAKNRGLKITCEVAPHHLFLTEEDIPALGSGRSEVRPRLATAVDRDALWDNLDVVDCFATDHAPHTQNEKDGQNPPPGFPGLETALPLFLTAIHEGRLTLDDFIKRMHNNPRRIFNLPEQPDTWIDVDPTSTWKIQSEPTFTRCGWTPFEGWKVHGQLRRVILRSREVYRDGEVLVSPGFGENLRKKEIIQ